MFKKNNYSIENMPTDKTGGGLSYENLSTENEILPLLENNDKGFKTYYKDNFYSITGKLIDEKKEYKYLEEINTLNKYYLGNNPEQTKKKIKDTYKKKENIESINDINNQLDSHDFTNKSYHQIVENTLNQIRNIDITNLSEMTKIIESNYVPIKEFITKYINSNNISDQDSIEYFQKKQFCQNILYAECKHYLEDVYFQEDINKEGILSIYNKRDFTENINSIKKANETKQDMWTTFLIDTLERYPQYEFIDDKLKDNNEFRRQLRTVHNYKLKNTIFFDPEYQMFVPFDQYVTKFSYMKANNAQHAPASILGALDSIEKTPEHNESVNKIKEILKKNQDNVTNLYTLSRVKAKLIDALHDDEKIEKIKEVKNDIGLYLNTMAQKEENDEKRKGLINTIEIILNLADGNVNKLSQKDKNSINLINDYIQIIFHKMEKTEYPEEYMKIYNNISKNNFTGSYEVDLKIKLNLFNFEIIAKLTEALSREEKVAEQKAA